MNNEQEKARELATLLSAFADGKIIQYKYNGKWHNCQDNMWGIHNMSIKYDTRIKPETKRIALAQQDLIDRIKEGKTMWIRHSITEYFEQIESFSPHCISLHSHINSIEYQYLTDFTFLDGTPCYKEVECE